jgi:U4/U6.U5 tri-snRNP-associated protein 3
MSGKHSESSQKRKTVDGCGEIHPSGKRKKSTEKEPETKPSPVELDAELSAEEIQMMAAMGIPFGFGSTQGKKVEDESCNVGAVKVNSKRSARQYMNRKKGFNKALPSEKTGEKVPIEGYARR